MRLAKRAALEWAARTGQGAEVAAILRQEKRAVPADGSELEAQFEYQLRVLAPDLPAPEREYAFDEGRGWRFDFAWPCRRGDEEKQVAVEIEGYGHRLDNRYTRDVEKYNAAALAGWIVLRITHEMLDDLTGLALVQRALGGRGHDAVE